MHWKKVLGVLLLALALGAVAASQRKTDSTADRVTSQQPRFQLLNAYLNQGGASQSDKKALFMVDSQTGRVWQYSPGIWDGNAKSMTPDVLVRIPVDGVDGVSLKEIKP
jgi:hypothetical protein